MAVKLTETAAREIHQIIDQQDLDHDKICLRVGVKGGGCSGFSYILDLTEARKDSDEAWEFEFATAPKKSTANTASANAAADGNVAVAEGDDDNSESEGGEKFTITVICDPKSYLYLNNTEIDFKDEVMGRGFVFNNPNATNTCGCGSSFSA